MEKYKDFTREQMIEELEHREKLIAQLSQSIGTSHTQIASQQILLQQKEEQLQKQTQQMMDYIEKTEEPEKPKLKKA